MDSRSYWFLRFQKTQSVAKFSSKNIINLNLSAKLCLLPCNNSCNGMDYWTIFMLYLYIDLAKIHRFCLSTVCTCHIPHCGYINK